MYVYNVHTTKLNEYSILLSNIFINNNYKNRELNFFSYKTFLEVFPASYIVLSAEFKNIWALLE